MTEANGSFVAAVEAIYDAAPEPALWPAALEAIAACFDDFGANLFWSRDDGRVGIVTSPSLEESGVDYVTNWADRDFRATRFVERLYYVRGDAVTDYDVASEEEMATQPFYTEFLARYNLKWMGAITISPDPRVIIGLCIQRLASKPVFTAEELALLARLGRHAEKSLRLSIRLFDVELVQTSLGEALGRIDIGVFALDTLGRVIFSNSVGTALLGDGLEMNGDRLRVTSIAQRASMERSLRHVLGRSRGQELEDDPRPILVERSQSTRPLALYILPIANPAGSVQQLLVQARAILLLINPDSAGPPDVALVRDVLRLTFGEARVAALIGTGLSPRETADKLGIAYETARNVLKRVFVKTGTTRQSELTALLSKIVR